jgi:hypothetical protein
MLDWMLADSDNVGLVITLVLLAAFGIFVWCRARGPLYIRITGALRGIVILLKAACCRKCNL